MANWVDKYQGLFGTPQGAQNNIGALGNASGYTYWRDKDTNQPVSFVSSVPPDWATQQSTDVRNAKPGDEFGKKSESMMDYLNAVATGQRSASLEQGTAAAAAAEGAAQGRLKSGPWSTAAVRGAAMAGNTAAMEIGSQAYQSSLVEKQQAQQAYLQAVENQRKQDISAELALEELARRYREMGLSDEQARAAALQQYEKDMISRYGISAQGTALWNEKNASEQAAIGSMIGAGLGAMAGGIAGGPAGAAAGSSLGATAGGAIGKNI